MTRVENEVAFGLENIGVAPEQIWPRVEAALGEVGASPSRDAAHGRALGWGAAARLPRIGARARSPQLLLLDEPTSQLDADGAEAFLARCGRHAVPSSSPSSASTARSRSPIGW